MSMFVLSPEAPILVVDDNEADRDIADYVLADSALENTVLLFEDGAAVLKHMEAVEAGEQALPALILLDINMLGRTGFEVLAHLRSKAAFSQRPVIAMLTSSDAEQDRQTAQRLGADECLAKQSGITNFVALIDRTFRN